MRKPQSDSEILNYLEHLKEEQYTISLVGSSWYDGNQWSIKIQDPLDREVYICREQWPVSLRDLLKTAVQQVWEDTGEKKAGTIFVGKAKEHGSPGDPVPLVKAKWWETLLRKCGVHILWKVRPMKPGDKAGTIGYAMEYPESEEAIEVDV